MSAPSSSSSSVAGESSAAASIGPWRVAILATTTETLQGSKPFTVYVLSVHYTIPAELLGADEAPIIDWTVTHRYSDFETLRAKMCEFSTQVPALPGKSWFGSLKSDTVAARKVGLNTFLGECLQRPWVAALPEWREFLAVATNVPSKHIYEWHPVEVKTVRNTGSSGAGSESYGVNDLIYRSRESVLILGMEEQSIIQKAGNLVSGIRSPFSKQAPARPMPLGCIRVLRQADEAGTWKTMCAVSSPAGVVCLAYHADSRTLYAGLDNGHVNEYRVHPAHVELELKRELAMHGGQRCTALHFHTGKHFLMSAGRDKKLVIRALDDERGLLSETLVGSTVNAGAWISAMEVDEASDLVFVGTYSQFIHCYSFADPTAPKLLHTLEGHTGSVRCLQYRPSERYLFSGGFDAAAGIWSIPGGGSDAILRARSVGWLKEGANEKIKSIVFIPAQPRTDGSASYASSATDPATQGLVVAGQDGGFISVFSVSTGRMTYAMRAHSSSVVKLVHLPEAGVLISAGLDGQVKFWSIPAHPIAGGVAEIVALEQATDALALAAAGLVGGGSSPSIGSQQRRKSSSLVTSAPPPSMVPSGASYLHKNSRADSIDGVTLFSSSYADASASDLRNTRTSFFQEEDEAEIAAEIADEALPAAVSVADDPAPISPAHATSATTSSTQQIEANETPQGATDAVEVAPEPEEEDMF